jgi:hypothetical protein
MMSDAISTRIELLRSRARGGEAARLAGRCLITLVAGLMGWLALDYWIVTALFGTGWWDFTARLALTGTLLTLLGRELRRGLIAEFMRRRGDDELAMRLEDTHPELAGRLISTVQLLRELVAGNRAKVGSTGLVEALAEDAQERAQAVDHRRAWDLRPARRAVLAAAGLLAAGLALAAWRADIAEAFLRRLLFRPAHYPTSTRIIAVRVPELVGRGDPVPVEVEVDLTSSVPAYVTTAVRGADGRTSTLRLERIAADGRALYRGALKLAVDELAMRPRAGDHRWESWVPVRVAPRPAVKSLNLRLQQPEYLRRPESLSTVGDLQVPAGTVVVVEAALSRPVAEAGLSLAVGLGEPKLLPLAISADGSAATGRFTVAEDGWWSIGLNSADGLSSGSPPRWSIAAIPDRAPTVVATFPPRDKDVTRFARWPVRFTARDDYGLAGARLRWLVVPSGADPESISTTPASRDIPGVSTDGAESTQGEISFDLSPLNLENGSRVVWWVEVRDVRMPEANLGTSQRGTFNILDPRELKERMARQQAELLNTLKAVRDRQREAREGVEGASKAAEERK